MKNFLLGIIFISCSSAINAQETTTISNDDTIEENVSTGDILPKESSSIIGPPEKMFTNLNKITSYGETSKVAFYEALIAKNEFKIILKGSKNLVIRNRRNHF